MTYTTPPSSQSDHHTPLRIGLFLDALTVPAWVFQAVADIIDSPIANIVLLVMNDSPPKARSRNYFLYDLYIKFDQRRFVQQPDALKSTNLKEIVSDYPAIHVVPESSNSGNAFLQADVDKIRAYNLDVVICFGFQQLQGKILETARHGFWSNHPTNPQSAHNNPSGFWETMNKEGVMANVMTVHSPEHRHGRIIYRSYASASNLSVSRTNNVSLWKSASIILLKLKELYEYGSSALEKTYDEMKPRETPGNLRMLTLYPKIALRLIQKRLENLDGKEQWQIAYLLGHEQESLADTFTQFKFLKPPIDHFWADPFVVKKDGKFYIFIEDFVNELNRGILAVIEMDDKGNYQDAQPIMQKPYHLSYPFIFEWENDYYMIPETHENQTIDLYRSVSFPDQWELVKTMISGVTAADATLLELDGKWWMFVTIGKNSLNDDLYIFYADSPLGEWKPHKLNPVKSDVRSSRPAGHIFKRGDTYYRPAQDCSVRYGYAIVIHKIVQLDTETYIEEPVSKVLPHGHTGIIGTHTINHTEGISVIDGIIVVPNKES